MENTEGNKPSINRLLLDNGYCAEEARRSLVFGCRFGWFYRKKELSFTEKNRLMEVAGEGSLSVNFCIVRGRKHVYDLWDSSATSPEEKEHLELIGYGYYLKNEKVCPCQLEYLRRPLI